MSHSYSAGYYSVPEKDYNEMQQERERLRALYQEGALIRVQQAVENQNLRDALLSLDPRTVRRLAAHLRVKVGEGVRMDDWSRVADYLDTLVPDVSCEAEAPRASKGDEN